MEGYVGMVTDAEMGEGVGASRGVEMSGWVEAGCGVGKRERPGQSAYRLCAVRVRLVHMRAVRLTSLHRRTQRSTVSTPKGAAQHTRARKEPTL
eukprot:4217537-Pyramimonas_sp.AAC.3